MYLKSKKLVSSFHMLDYKLKIDKPDKKAKKKAIQFYLEEAKKKQIGRITLSNRARICETRIE